MRSRVLKLFHIAAPAMVLFGPVPAAPAQSSSVDLSDPAFIEQGSEVFAKNCAVGYCHGSEGRAGRGPRLRDRYWNARSLFNTVRGGVPSKTMPGFRDILSEEQIWSVVAYVISLGAGDLDISGTVDISGPAGSDLLSEEARKGRDLFFDLTNQKRCGVCHRLGSKGTAIGPNLAATSPEKSEQELRKDVTAPGSAIAKGFEQTVLVTASGERVRGLKKEESAELIRLYDMAAIPPPLRTFYKNQIRSVSTRKRSSMPSGYGEMYSGAELSAIIAYLKSGRF